MLQEFIKQFPTYAKRFFQGIYYVFKGLFTLNFDDLRKHAKRSDKSKWS